MISGHGTNSILFNKKIKVGRPEHSLTPHTLLFAQLCRLPSSIGFPNTSNELIFLRHCGCWQVFLKFSKIYQGNTCFGAFFERSAVLRGDRDHT